MLDVASAVRVSLFSEANVLVAQPLFDIDVTVPGRTALLSPDGDYVLTRVDITQPNEVRIYEAATGDDVYTGIRPTEVALDAAFGPDDTVTYVVAVRDHSPEEGDYLRLSATGPHLLRTCELEAGRCRTISQFDNATGETVLAH